MTMLDESRTVSQMLLENPARSRVFEKHRIDYCCGGKVPLAEACAKKGIALETVLQELKLADAARASGDEPDFAAMPLDQLADHIVETHHAYLAAELPRLTAMASRVARVHGDGDARLVELDTVLQEVVQELDAHMGKEENILFPIISMMAQTHSVPSLPFGSIANPIHMMESEHDSAGDGLTRMRELTDGYTPPDWACNTYRALLNGLETLEKDLHQHIHKENNILFPRAIELEASLQQA